MEINFNHQKPLVSIDCLAYNHELYIRETLDGFIRQKTNFKFEVLVHDDASTDKTADIIREYEQKYPEIIKPIYQSENQYSKGISISSQFQCPRAQGKYYAMCEGDDYWTDPFKLQKQVDFLELNPDYGLVHGNIDKLFNKTGRIKRNTINKAQNRLSSQNDVFIGLLLNSYSVATLTVLARKELICKAFGSIDTSSHLMGDLPTWLELSQKTKFHFIESTVGVYRKVSGSASNTQQTYLAFIESGLRIRLEFADKYSTPKSVKNKLKIDYLKNQLLRAFYSKDKILAKEYFLDMNRNDFEIKFLDKLIYNSIHNSLLYTLIISLDKIRQSIIRVIKFILRINVY